MPTWGRLTLELFSDQVQWTVESLLISYGVLYAGSMWLVWLSLKILQFSRLNTGFVVAVFVALGDIGMSAGKFAKRNIGTVAGVLVTVVALMMSSYVSFEET